MYPKIKIIFHKKKFYWFLKIKVLLFFFYSTFDKLWRYKQEIKEGFTSYLFLKFTYNISGLYNWV